MTNNYSNPKIESSEKSLQELLNVIIETKNPFKLFFLISSLIQAFQDYIYEMTIMLKIYGFNNSKQSEKHALLYNIFGKDFLNGKESINEMTFKNETEWKRLELKKGVLSVHPRFLKLSTLEKEKIVLDYYGKKDKDSKIQNLELVDEKICLKLSAKNEIINEYKLTLDQALIKLRKFGGFFEKNINLACEKEPLLFEYYSQIFQNNDIKNKNDIEILDLYHDTIQEYIDKYYQFQIDREFEILLVKFNSKFKEAIRNAEYYNTLYLLKNSILQISNSGISSFLLPHISCKLAKAIRAQIQLVKNNHSVTTEHIQGLLLTENILTEHFAMSYDEYYQIKKFFSGIKREIKKPSKFNYLVIGVLVLLLFVLPIFFGLLILLYLSLFFLEKTHTYKRVSLKFSISYLKPIIVLTAFICGFFSLAFMQNDFYKIQYDKYKYEINYLLLQSFSDIVGPYVKTNILENSGANRIESLDAKYKKCLEFNYIIEKKSCLESFSEKKE